MLDERESTHRQRALLGSVPRFWFAVIVSLALVAGLVVFPTGNSAKASSSPSHLFWVDSIDATIGRMQLSGAASNSNFYPASGAKAMVATGTHLYWSVFSENRIGRMNIDGTGANPNWMSVPSPGELAVANGYLYWVSGGGQTGSIGRAKLDGTGINNDFVPSVMDPYYVAGLAVTSQFVFWADAKNESIWRANWDGSGATDFIATQYSPMGLVVVGTNLYWPVFYPKGTVGRSNLDGSSKTDSHMVIPSDPTLTSIATDGTHLYFGAITGNPETSSIIRTGLSNPTPTTLRANMIPGMTKMAIAPGVPYPTPGKTTVTGFDFKSPKSVRVHTKAPTSARTVQYRIRPATSKSYSSWRTSKSKKYRDEAVVLSKGAWIQVRSVSPQGAVSPPTTSFVRAQVSWATKGKCRVKSRSIRYSAGKAVVNVARQSGSCLRWRQTKKNSSRYHSWKKVRASKLTTNRLGSKTGTVQLKAGRKSVKVWTYLPR